MAKGLVHDVHPVRGWPSHSVICASANGCVDEFVHIVLVEGGAGNKDTVRGCKLSEQGAFANGVGAVDDVVDDKFGVHADAGEGRRSMVAWPSGNSSTAAHSVAIDEGKNASRLFVGLVITSWGATRSLELSTDSHFVHADREWFPPHFMQACNPRWHLPPD